MRLDKYVKHVLCVSRSEAIDLIKNKQILVNDSTKLKDYDVNDLDIVTFNGKRLEYKEFYYYMLNKPAGYICSTTSHDGTPVTGLIKERNDLFPVGRLDKDTEGLIILTNDGGMAHKLTSPNHDIEKKYYVESKNNIRKEDIDSFLGGVDIRVDDSIYKCKPAKLEIIDDHKSCVYIKEGKFHQVKEMYKAIDNMVLYLKRTQIGEIVLDDKLDLGQYRELNEGEIAYLKSVK